MSRRATPRRPCQQLRRWRPPSPQPPHRTGWRAWAWCNLPVTHKVRWPWGQVWTTPQDFDDESRPIGARFTVEVCEQHAYSIRDYQQSTGTRVGVYRFRRV